MNTIYCKVTEQGLHSFFMKVDGKRYFLFNQNYRKSVQEYFAGGVSITEAMNHSKAHHNEAIMRTMTKMPIYIKYAEQEYGVAVLKQTQKKCNYRSVIKYTC